MKVPTTVDAGWIATLGDGQLLEAEALLHAEFVKQETAEKRRMGARYALLRGSEALVSAWHRWLMVNNETTTRGVVVHRQPRPQA